MAQPITLLRSHLYLARIMDAAGGRSHHRMFSDAEAGVEHLSTIFRLMQELVYIESVPAKVSPVPLSSVIAPLLEDAEVAFAGTDLRLDAQHALPLKQYPREEASGTAMVTADLKRTRHAIVSMLHVARETAQPGSSVAYRVEASEGWVELKIRPESPLQGSPEDHLDEVARLRLALAKGNIRGQRAMFYMAANPFSLSIKLPVARRQA